MKERPPPPPVVRAEEAKDEVGKPLHGRDIVCVGFADWDNEVWTNQQHLMSRLSRDNRVLFIESLGLRRPEVQARDLRRLVDRLRKGVRPLRSTDGVHVLSPLVVPLHSRPAIRRLNAAILRFLVKRATRQLVFREPILWGYVPQAHDLVSVLRPESIVYHCVDDIGAQKGVDADSFREAESRFLAAADLVIASSPPLARRLQPQSRRMLYAPNVADHALFAQALEAGDVDTQVHEIGRPRIVFVGTISATKVDVPLLIDLARLRLDWSFVLVGPVGLGDPSTDVSSLQAEPNIHLLGPRPYGDLPRVLRGADAALIPYVRNRLTDSVFPMKVFEYLAAGLAVVATPLPSLADVAEVAIAESASAIEDALENIMRYDSRTARRSRSQAARSHDWEERLAEIGRALTAVAPNSPPNLQPRA